MTIIIGYLILAYIDYDACRERLLSHHYLQITTTLRNKKSENSAPQLNACAQSKATVENEATKRLKQRNAVTVKETA
jgi:hypothetical protein